MDTIGTILALNALHETETSPLAREDLVLMLDTAFHWSAAQGGRDGYLISFDRDAGYQSPNFEWFKSRYDRFVYTDRIVVAAHTRGQGVARALYEGLFERARAAVHTHVVCEINLYPPNPGSFAFHAKLGFEEIGQAQLANGKRVSYQVLPV